MSAARSTNSRKAAPAPIASEALTRIAALYRIEDDIRGRSADERRAIRQERSRPLVEALQPWLREKLSLISQKTKLAEAIRYAACRAGQAFASLQLKKTKKTKENIKKKTGTDRALTQFRCSSSA